MPLAGQVVVLEARRYPYSGGYREIARSSTGADGAYAFRTRLDRNARLRVLAPAQRARSRVLVAYTYPAFRLSFRAVRPGVVRVTQRYTVPRTVRLKASTLFYLGRRGAARSSLRVSAPTRRAAAGRYVAQAQVTLPDAWHGRFRYGSCFRTTPGSGMGRPDATCPHVFRF